MAKLPILITLGIAALGCTAESPDLVIVSGTVVDVAGGGLLPSQDLWVEDGSISYIGPSGERAVPRGTRTVDASDRFLLPGLTDAHVHLDHVDELELYLSQGVTTVFNLRGLPRHLEWRDAIARGERDGPTIYTTGDYIDGYPPFMQPMLSVETAEDAEAAVRRQDAAGYDMIKVYIRLGLDQLRAIGRTADELGLPVVGHSSENYTLQELIDAGQVNVAHGADLMRWYLDGSDDEAGIDRMVETLRGTATTVTSNLSFTAGLIRQAEDLDGMLSERIARALPAAILQPFRRANNRYISRGIEWVPDVKARFEKEKRFARDLHAAGVTLLAGTDASTAGVLPGTSLHLEVELMVEAGLSPLDALRAATLAPGRFVAEHVDAGERFGQLAEGYRADIVVLDRDPLEDPIVLDRISGVVARGRWFDRATLDAKLDELAARSRSLTPRVIEIEDGIKSGDLAAARAAFDTARARDPGAILFSQYVPFFIGYSYLYGDDGYNPDSSRRAAALTLYEMYAETYPEFHSSHYMLALAREANGDEAGAIESLERALAIHPSYPDARRKLEELRKRTGTPGPSV